MKKNRIGIFITSLFFPNISAFAFQSTHRFNVRENTDRGAKPSLFAFRFFFPFASVNEGDGDNGDVKNDSSELMSRAEKLREEVRELERNLSGTRKPRQTSFNVQPENLVGRSLKNKRVLVVGANGRVGSMVCRYLLRNFPELQEVVATVHYVGDASTRGYGRLSYEVGAEDGTGRIGSAWSGEDRNAYFEYSEGMASYNLQKLRIVELELLDPVQCRTVTEGIDSVIWCATDFNGNKPKSISGLDIAFLFRAIADPKKGRVEIEGLTNILGGLKQSKMDRRRINSITDGSSSLLDSLNDPISCVLLSPAPYIFNNFETPFGEFNGMKREGEKILRDDFPSLTYCILQMGKYDENFVEENLDFMFSGEGMCDDKYEIPLEVKKRRKINPRDAARCAGDALLKEEFLGKTIEVWTAEKGR